MLYKLNNLGIFLNLSIPEYEKSKLVENQASGDDQFLLNYVKNQYKNTIKYAMDSGAIVSTTCSSDWGQMIKQRARWAKKNIESSVVDKLISSFLLFAQFLLPICFLLSFIDRNFLGFFWTVFILKTLVELILAYEFMIFFKINRLKYVPLFALMYPFFLFKTLLLVNDHTHVWKGRKI